MTTAREAARDEAWLRWMDSAETYKTEHDAFDAGWAACEEWQHDAVNNPYAVNNIIARCEERYRPLVDEVKQAMALISDDYPFTLERLMAALADLTGEGDGQ